MASLRTYLLVLGAALGAVAACSSESTTAPGDPGKGSTGGSGGSGGSVYLGLGGNISKALLVEPKDPVMDLTGAAASLQFTAKFADGSAANAVRWDVDDVVVGVVAQSGQFDAHGFVAGKVKLSAESGGVTGSTTITVRVKMVDNAAGLSASEQAALRAGGSDDATFRWLYPYTDTVFPRGISGPELQLAGTAAEASYLKVSVGDFSYEGFFGASDPVQIAYPQAAWDAMTKSAGPAQPVSVQVSKRSAGKVTGPASETWTIAPGSLKGAVYYNTYRSAQTNTGAVMRVRPGKSAEVVIAGCTVCHSVAANGKVITAGVDWSSGNPIDSGTFNIDAAGVASQRHLNTDGRRYSFGGLTPDGDMLLSSGIPPSGLVMRGLTGTMPSRLYDTATGAEIAVPSFSNVVDYALAPAFAPDGSRVAFNHQQGNAKTIAMMDFNGAQSPPLFSGYQALVTTADNVAAWPSFLPDANAVVYHSGEHFDTGNHASHKHANLRMVDVPTKTVVDLDLLNGVNGTGFYLPYGEAEEANLNYEPTVLPVAVGGYYWVVFTSRRAYGNTIAPGGTLAGGDNKWGTNPPGGERPSPRKKLWVAAIDVNYQGKGDPSHPAFYLSGQELDAGNMRGFASLDPCKDDGKPCESAAECCNGYCRPVEDKNGKVTTVCVPPPGDCARIDERCVTAADCCDSQALCINERCSLPTPK